MFQNIQKKYIILSLGIVGLIALILLIIILNKKRENLVPPVRKGGPKSKSK